LAASSLGRVVTATCQSYPPTSCRLRRVWFLLLATDNPIEHEGTFPLPEAQLDRFLMCISLGYPTPEEELAIVRDRQ
jgi:MoxR-like ATPase